MSETSQQSTPRMNVESFNLDHTKVAAPYVRVADRKELPGGDVLVKYDVRFCQPNREHLEMEAVHSIEHLSAELMRNHTDRLIDFSPMGCQTGFYALMLGVETEEFLPLLEATFRDILTAQEVPAANEVPWDEAMAALEVPALLLTGDRPGSARVGSEGLAAAARNPRINPVLVPGAGHQVRRSDPQAFYRAVDTWLAEVLPVG